ncbi:MAG: hypothetical protein ACTSU2_16190 [Promethearchaeota archaeon]
MSSDPSHDLIKEKQTYGIYKSGIISNHQIWNIFLEIFDASKTRKVASYKYGVIYSIIKVLENDPDTQHIKFNKLFKYFTPIYWSLIIKHRLYQIQKGVITSIYKLFWEFVFKNNNYRNVSFYELDWESQQYLIREVGKKAKRNVFHALYTDSRGYIFSYNLKEKYIELNPIFQKFICTYKEILKKANFYEWAKFMKLNNPDKEVDIGIFLNFE